MKILLAMGVVALATLPKLHGQAPDFANTVRPVLAKHCFSCHNAKLTFGKLNLEATRDPGSASSQTDVWEKVREKVAAGKMPPPGQPVPSKTELAVVTTWIDSILKTNASRLNPGRVMARR
jgi:uncharacterized membrane protein